MASNIIERHIPCPHCSSSNAYCRYDDGHGYCFSCLKFDKGDYLSDTGTDYTYQFYGRRGITEQSFRHFGCQTKIDPEGKPVSVGYKYPDGAIKVRDLDTKAFHWTTPPKPGLYGSNLYGSGSHKYVTITEGEEDAHSLWQVLRSPVVSVQSASTARRDCTASVAWLAGFERIYLCFDNDAPGREAVRSVARLFDYNKLYVVKLTNHKDANEYLQAGEDQELLNIWTNSRRYVPDDIISTFQEFEECLGMDTMVGVSYPWPTVTAMTYGIRTHESILVTAPEGVGKTEWVKAIEHHLLKETDDNVAGIFLEEPKERHLKSLVGIEIGAPVHLPDSGRSVPDQVDALRKLVKRDGRLYLYNHFGSNDPEHLLDTIRFLVSACSCRYVLLDHLTMAVAGLAGDDERRALDYMSSRLEMMVKELGFALIMVCHVNDLGQTRGSRLPSKVADIRIDLARDFTNPDPDIQKVVNMNISKPSRFTGQAGYAGSLSFDSDTRRFTEIPKGEPDVRCAVN